MTDKPKPRLRKTMLHGGDHVQVAVQKRALADHKLVVEYEHDGSVCTSTGIASQGVPVPAGAKILRYGVVA